jgi:hypothetical protein
MPASVASCAFMFSSKNLPPLARNCCRSRLVARVARLAEVAGAVDVRRHVVGDELGDLRVVLPGFRHFERLAELGLIGILQLGSSKMSLR